MTLKEFVHSQLLTWSEFKNLDEETQQKWREVHQRKNREEQIENAKEYKEHCKWWEEYKKSKEYQELLTKEKAHNNFPEKNH